MLIHRNSMAKDRTMQVCIQICSGSNAIKWTCKHSKLHMLSSETWLNLIRVSEISCKFNLMFSFPFFTLGSQSSHNNCLWAWPCVCSCSCKSEFLLVHSPWNKFKCCNICIYAVTHKHTDALGRSHILLMKIFTHQWINSNFVPCN